MSEEGNLKFDSIIQPDKFRDSNDKEHDESNESKEQLDESGHCNSQPDESCDSIKKEHDGSSESIHSSDESGQSEESFDSTKKEHDGSSGSSHPYDESCQWNSQSDEYSQCYGQPDEYGRCYSQTDESGEYLNLSDESSVSHPHKSAYSYSYDEASSHPDCDSNENRLDGHPDDDKDSYFNSESDESGYQADDFSDSRSGFRSFSPRTVSSKGNFSIRRFLVDSTAHLDEKLRLGILGPKPVPFQNDMFATGPRSCYYPQTCSPRVVPMFFTYPQGGILGPAPLDPSHPRAGILGPGPVVLPQDQNRTLSHGSTLLSFSQGSKIGQRIGRVMPTPPPCTYPHTP